MCTIRLIYPIHDLGIEEVVDHRTTRGLVDLTLSHLKRSIKKAARVYLIHENGHSCTVIKGDN